MNNKRLDRIDKGLDNVQAQGGKVHMIIIPKVDQDNKPTGWVEYIDTLTDEKWLEDPQGNKTVIRLPRDQAGKST